VSSSHWLKSEPYELLLNYLEQHPELSQELRASPYTDLDYGLAYIKAVQCIREGVYNTKPGLRELHQMANEKDSNSMAATPSLAVDHHASTASLQSD
jgi:hypothetical protein